MAQNREEQFMRMVIDAAVQNVHNGLGGPFAAMVVKGDEVVAMGTNQVTTTNDPTAHAEISAIRAACTKLGSFQLSGCEIYTSCEPCPMCLGALYWARPDHIYFAATRQDAAASGFEDSFIYDEVGLEFGSRNIATDHVLGGEGRRPFDAWDQKEDKVRY
ncbi:MAG: nucleoside deaminase [Spirochaetota bacterium]|jgi:tRNA(Arg) A34 adenosine deaminase TadA|nr:nucleoside deaminase [Spirochaetota bacterium]